MSASVSVILPTRNRPASLPGAVRSVLSQDFAELELIVVDDGSDPPAERAFGGVRDERLRLLRLEGVGPAAARNAGLGQARGEWIAFQDDDDEWLPGKLRKQMELARRGPSTLGVVYSVFVRPGPPQRFTPSRSVSPRRGLLHGALLAGNFIGLPTVLVRRSALDSVGPFDARLPCYEDWELLLRLSRGFHFDIVEEPLVRVGDSPMSVNKASSAERAEAFATILSANRAEIEARPAIHARYLFHIGHHLCLSGERGRGRRQLARSLALWPSLRGAAALAASCLGGSLYRSLSSLTATPEQRERRTSSYQRR
jgi:glycosyltransferase involved in cell wall biosynthesis